MTAPWRRNEHGALTGVKSTSYGENVRGLAYAHARDASETIFLNTAGDVCEGTGTNIFCVFGNRMLTPPLVAGPLAGVTRDVLLEWCDVVEEDFTLATAAGADEVFITSSLRDVQGVTSGTRWTYPAPGPRTAEISRAVPGQERRAGRSVSALSADVKPCPPWDMVGVALRGWGDWRSGSALRSHRRGHWFEPSIAHPLATSEGAQVPASQPAGHPAA